MVLLNWLNGSNSHKINLAKQPGVVIKKGTEQVIRLCVDSGATTGCISTARMNLIIGNPMQGSKSPAVLFSQW